MCAQLRKLWKKEKKPRTHASYEIGSVHCGMDRITAHSVRADNAAAPHNQIFFREEYLQHFTQKLIIVTVCRHLLAALKLVLMIWLIVHSEQLQITVRSCKYINAGKHKVTGLKTIFFIHIGI